MNRGTRWILGFGFFLTFSIACEVRAEEIYQIGTRGQPVYELQSRLFHLKYLAIAPTGYFGSLTIRAVKEFQREHGLAADGIVGPETTAALYQGRGQHEIATRNRWSELVQIMAWKIANQVWERGQIARITDVETGKTFRVKRFGGDWHCDTEPLTRSDTRTMFEIFGHHWSWERRAVIVELNDYRSAASINGYPHGPSRGGANGFRGHFCVHFLGSRVHRSLQVDAEHQRMIWKAAASQVPVNRPAEDPENSGLVSNQIGSE